VVFSNTSTTPATQLCSVTLTGGTVPVCNYAFAAQGTYSVVAIYTSGDTNFATSTSVADSQGVGAGATAVVLSSSPAAAVIDQPVTFTATINTNSGSTPPQGTMVYTDTLTNTTLCSVSLTASGSVPACAFAFPALGTHTVSAAYTSSNSNFSNATSNVLPEAVTQATTATSLASLPNPSAVNQSVAFTATVTPAYSGVTKPTGTVVFSNTSTTPATQLCSVTLTGGTVPVCNYAFAAQGTYNVVAIYTTGDSNFASSTSVAVLQGVGAGATAVALSSSPSAAVINQPVTFTASINTNSGSTAPQGTMVYTDTFTNKVLCSVSLTVSGSVPACTVAFPALGTHTVSAAYTSSNTNFSNATSNLLSEAVTQASTTTGVVSSPNPSNVNQSVAFTATVTPAFSGAAVPTGTVVFSNTSTSPATQLCPAATLTAGTVPVCNYAFASKGSNNVIAIYTSGDANFASSTSSPVSQLVGSGATSVTLAASPNPSSVDQSVTFNATINFVTSGTAQPTGTVTYFDSGVQLTNCLFTGTVAAPFKNGSVPPCTVPLITQGTHTITAAYGGDTNFSASTSPSLSQIVNTTGTTTTVASSANPSAVNASVTFTATVTPAFTAGKATPTGTVSFSATPAGGTSTPLNCATVTLPPNAAPATATCTAPLTAAGNYTVTATYTSGDTNFASGLPGTITQTVSKANLTLAVTSSYMQGSTVVTSPALQGNSVVNQPLTFTATIKIPTAGTSPTSSVTFTDTSTGVPLCPDIAVASTSSPIIFSAVCVPPAATTPWVAATHTIVATYNGDSNFPLTSSPVFSQIVSPGPATATVISSAQTSVATQTVTFTATITPTYTGPVLPRGNFKFASSTGVWIPSAPCPTVGVNNGTVTGTGTAVCSVQFPATAGSQTITATYENDANFIGANNSAPVSSVAQTVQNFTIANSVTSALNATSTIGPVYLTEGYSTATPSAAGTDPFNPTTVQMDVMSTGGFTDTLDLKCQVTNAISSAVVSDPSCAVSATASGANGTALTYTTTASSSAPIGAYVVTLTATDNSTQALANAAALTVYVVGQANVLSLAQGASGTESVSFNTSTAPANSTLVSFTCGTVWNLTTKAQLTASQIAGLTCTGPASVAITGASTSTSISISTSGKAVALLRASSSISMAAFLGIPLFALMGWVGSRKSPRKNFFRFLGLILLLVGVSYASGCGGSFTSTSKSTSSGIAPGSYLVQVVGTDQNGNKYYAAVPLDVSAN